MKKNLSVLLLVTLLLFTVSHLSCQDNGLIPTPEKFFGFKPGSDRNVFNYQPLIEYLKTIDEVSPRVQMIEIGSSPLGRKMYITFISSEENIKNLQHLKEINKSLAIDPNLDEGSVKKLVKDGKVFILATLSMHSTEVGPSQAAPLIVYDLATTQDQKINDWLSQVVYMIVPSHNPDGMDMVVDYYNKTKGTKYEGSYLPQVYHKYVGHDNNRDFVTLSQEDTRVIAEIYNKTWFPQVMVEKHQMGSYGPRYYVPPCHDPISENVDEELWNWMWIFGSNMSTDMTKQGLAGVSQHYLFDDYWPGSTETAIWKNVIGLLTECASVQVATPINIEQNELSAGGKGLGEYKKSINMPLLWEGGWWRLGDIVEYEITSTYSLIKTAYLHKEDILKFRNNLCKKEVKKGKTQAPYYFVISSDQHDPSEMIGLLELLNEQGISVYKNKEQIILEDKIINKGDYIVPLAQPFRSFIKEVLEAQKFPERHYTPNGKLIEPYDITSWSLPLHRAVKSFEINTSSETLNSNLDKVIFPLEISNSLPEDYSAILLSANLNESYAAVFMALQKGIEVKRIIHEKIIQDTKLPAGSFIISKTKKNSGQIDAVLSALKIKPVYTKETITESLKIISLPKVALVESNFHDMDAGWTRYVFDTYTIPYKVIKPGDFNTTTLTDFDIIVFPNEDKSVLLEGKYKGKDDTYNIPTMDPKYTKGIGKEGLQKIMKFVNEGGIILSWGESAGLFMGPLSITTDEKTKEEFQLPVKDISKDLEKQKLNCPGSLLQINLVRDHPLTYGMPATAGVFSRGKPVFTTSIPYFDMDRKVIAAYPEEHILLSGYADKEELLANKSAMVWLKKGKGQIVLYGFNPQFRASTSGTYKLMFNALLL
ncbi:MAG: hypothetical protein JXJ22_10315 [Bacteroidales bacterium]|nr:hypothetical protein [Bacteroidales bacterium]